MLWLNVTEQIRPVRAHFTRFQHAKYCAASQVLVVVYLDLLRTRRLLTVAAVDGAVSHAEIGSSPKTTPAKLAVQVPATELLSTQWETLLDSQLSAFPTFARGLMLQLENS